jgi:hypothetical protein
LKDEVLRRIIAHADELCAESFRTEALGAVFEGPF